MKKRLYVCNGKVPDCPKTYCAFKGTGDCSHTSDIRYARYSRPREWDVLESGSRIVMIERLRPDGK